MSLWSLLYLLSLSSVVLGEQDVLGNAGLDLSGPPSSGSLVLLTKTITYAEPIPIPTQDLNPAIKTLTCPPNTKQCNDTCIPSTQDCCSTAACSPGDYCYFHSGETRCCPQGLACFEISGVVCYEQTVLWYEEVHVVEEEDVATSWDLMESIEETTTGITVTASYPAEGRSLYTSLSESIAEGATVILGAGAISTRTVTAMGGPTEEPSLFDDIIEDYEDDVRGDL